MTARLMVWYRGLRKAAAPDVVAVPDDLRNLALEALLTSPLFDHEWYARSGAGFFNGRTAAAEHFLDEGAAAGRSPSPQFDSAAYLAANADVQAAALNPLVHFLHYGAAEGRLAVPTATHLLEVTTRGVLDLAYDTAYDRAAPLRILYICHSMEDREGAPQSLFDLVTGLRETCRDVPMVFGQRQGPMAAAYQQAGVPVLCPDRADYDYQADQFRATLTAFRPDVVLGNTALSLWLLLIAARSGVPTVAILRESATMFREFRFGPLPLMEASRASLRSARKVVFVSKASQELWQTGPELPPTAVIRNPRRSISLSALLQPAPERLEDLPAGDPAQARDLVFLSVGSITERKNQMEMVQAFAALDAPSQRASRLVLVGARGGPYLAQIKAVIAGLPQSTASRISLIPETKDISHWYRQADIFLFSSLSEAYPRVIGEALCYGLPIITSRAEGVEEQVEDGVSALIYDAGDSAALSVRMAALLQDPARRKELAAAAQRAAARLPDSAEVLAAYRAVLEEVLVKKTRRQSHSGSE